MDGLRERLTTACVDAQQTARFPFPRSPSIRKKAVSSTKFDRPILTARKRRVVRRVWVEDQELFTFATSSLGGHFALPTIDTAVAFRP